MGLKQIKDIDRIVFLKMFVEEMLISFTKDSKSKEVVKEEKLKIKIFKSFPESTPIFTPLPKEKSQKVTGQLKELEKKEPIKEEPMRKVPIHLTNTKSKPIPQMFRTPKPSANMPRLYGIEKINKLLGDKAIQSIECPGPGKYIIIKRRNEINLTRIVMTQEEILKVIEYFSQQARIPAIGGILKAAIGDLLISAVSSKFIGSRFVINRKTPYSLIRN